MSNKLTSKQLHFCRCVASGMTQTQAYREAYNVKPETKANSVNEVASRLASDPRIRSRIDQLIAQRERGMVVSALSDRERVLTKLRHWMDNAEATDSNKIRSAELLGKSVGLFKDVVETTDNRSSTDLLDELEAMLESTADQSADHDDRDAGDRQLH